MWMIFLWVAITSKTFPVKITAVVSPVSLTKTTSQAGQELELSLLLKCGVFLFFEAKGVRAILICALWRCQSSRFAKCRLLPRAGKGSMPRLACHPSGDSIPCHAPTAQQPGAISSSRAGNPVLAGPKAIRTFVSCPPTTPRSHIQFWTSQSNPVALPSC